jgi:hypothetical protein
VWCVSLEQFWQRMLPQSTKEEPNTKNVIIWPEKIRDQIRIVEQYDQIEKLRFRQKNNDEKKSNQEKEIIAQQSSINNERIEYYIFLVFGSLIWLLIAHTVLKWHQFPFHKHVYESLVIYLCPLVVIFFVLFLLDFGITRLDVKKQN